MGMVIVYALLSLIVGISIGAGIIMLSTRIVAGFVPKFLLAAATFVVAYIAAIAASWILAMVMGQSLITSLIALVVLFLVNSAVLNALVKTPSGMQMGFGKACLVTLVEIIVDIVLVVLMIIIFGAGMFSMLATTH